MPSSTLNGSLLLPPGSRLLYIGPMKTGTTAIQVAARDRRQTLLDHGVRYPGTKLNHRSALGALLGWSTVTAGRSGPLGPDRLDLDEGGIPDISEWDGIKAELEADTSRRILISHEFVSQAEDAACRRIVDELGPHLIHVAITLRSPAAILPSLWAQGLKDDAQTEPLDSWLSRIYDNNSDRPMPVRFRRAYDQAELVQRWARLIGPDRVTVIVVEESRPSALSDAFESLLGLPAGMLGRAVDSNRSFTAAEANAFLRLNSELAEHGVGWQSFNEFVWKGAATEESSSESDQPTSRASVCLPGQPIRRSSTVRDSPTKSAIAASASLAPSTSLAPNQLRPNTLTARPFRPTSASVR